MYEDINVLFNCTVDLHHVTIQYTIVLHDYEKKKL